MTQLSDDLRREFGEIDIYLFDQLLRGRISHDMRVLDAGCGNGRNLVFLLGHGFDVSATDTDPDAIAKTRMLAAKRSPTLGPDRFRLEPLEKMTFGDGVFDLVICSAVLHFARDDEHWWAMFRELWRVLANNGLLFVRLASTIGHESRIQPLGNRRYILPDGSERFLVDDDFLMNATRDVGGSLADPLKTSVVRGLRSMTTWVVRKRASV